MASTKTKKRRWWSRLAFWRKADADPQRKRTYFAAEQGRRTDSWRMPRTSVNAETDRALLPLRARARELVRNDTHAASAVSVLVNNLVGDGIRPRSNTGDADLDAQVNDLWARWGQDAASDGQQDVYGVQILACRAVVESGEVLLRRRWRRVTDGLAVPFQVETLEGDMLDETKTERTRRGQIVQGVEFNGRGMRARYWLYPEHPGALNKGFQGLTFNESRPVRASEISHAFEQQRPGQVRGVSWLAPSMDRLMSFSDYTDAEVDRKRMESSIFASVDGLDTGFALDPDGQERQGGQRCTDANGNDLEVIEPGTIFYAPPGAAMHLHAPASVGGVAEYRRQELTGIAAGLRLVYTLLTGDLTGVNYSSIRAGLVEFRRFVKAMRQAVIIRGICDPVWSWFIEAAILAGELPERESYPVVWSPPQFEGVDRLKDAQADALEILTLLNSGPRAVSARGLDPTEILTEQAEWLAKVREAGLAPPWSAGTAGAPAAPIEDEDEDSEDEGAE